MKDGIYFDLPMEEYVALPRLGAHSLGNLLSSPARFWESSWLNPSPREVSEAVEATRTIGAAYHCARLEPDQFEARYVRELDKDAYPGALVTTDDIKAAIVEAGHSPLTQIDTGQVKPAPTKAEPDRTKPVTRAARKDDLVRQLLDINPDALVWDQMVERHMAEHEGCVPLSGRVWDEIMVDGDRLRASPEIAALMADGIAEVSILWTDEKGVPCKCRPDKLAADRWLDLKTFANQQAKPLEQAITDAIRFNRYHVGAAHYRDGIEAVRDMARPLPVHGSFEQLALIEALRAADDFPGCWYVFQEKAGIPNIIAKRMRFREVPLSTKINNAITDDADVIRRVERATEQPALWWQRAKREVRKAKRLFRLYSDVYQPGEPWLPFNPLGEITDLSFSSHFLDEEIGE